MTIRALRGSAVADADTILVTGLRATAQGDRRAFERLYRLTSAKLFAVCRQTLADRQDAEEALQAAYLKVWRHAGAYDVTRGRPMTWLITVAHRCAVDVLRRRPREDPTAAPEPGALRDAAGPAETSRSDRLAACLSALDRRDEAMLRTAFFEGATYQEIAARAAQPLGTIKSRIRRALLSLAECLR